MVSNTPICLVARSTVRVMMLLMAVSRFWQALSLASASFACPLARPLTSGEPEGSGLVEAVGLAVSWAWALAFGLTARTDAPLSANRAIPVAMVNLYDSLRIEELP